MKWETFRNILAAAGAFFTAIIALALIVSYFTVGGGLNSSEKVVVVKLDGVILDPLEISMELKKLEEDADVKAVVVRIDSPGGAVGPSQEIYNSIKRLRKVKPVVASMGTIAASGGLYAAVAANKIVANPGTLTGSIGVIVEFINAEELLQKIGIKGSVVKSGKFKDTGSPLREMSEEERALLQSVIDDVNRQFIKAVADGRGMKIEDVEKIADGRIFTGSQAKENGLVDILGDLSDSIDLGAKLAGIKGKPFVVYPEKKGLKLLDYLSGESIARGISGMISGYGGDTPVRIMYLMRGVR